MDTALNVHRLHFALTITYHYLFPQLTTGLFTNPWLRWQYLHTMLGAVVTASIVMASVGVFYLLVRRHEVYGRTFVRLGVVTGLIAAMLLAFPTGDRQARLMAMHQPVGFAAMEGVFGTVEGAGLVLIGQPDVERMRLDNPIEVPGILSFLTHRSWSAEIKGLAAFAKEDWPHNIPLLYYAYHIMVGLGTILTAVLAVATFLLWLLIGRAIGIECRHQIDSPAWTPLWDVVFAVSSALLALFFGVALGNVVRGVPFDARGRFFAPLWTDFSPYGATGILDWYTLAVGLAALAALAMHGALWITMKSDEGLQARSRRTALRLWWAVMGLMALVTLATFHVQPHVWERLRAAPWGAVLPLLAVSALGLARWCCLKRCDVLAFLASAGFLGAMLVTVACSVFPYVLPASTDPALGLTLEHAAAEPYALQVGLAWWIPGMVLVTVYFFFVYRQFAGKVRLDEEGHY